MPTCEHCQALLLDFVYGLLEEPELAGLREHLANCRDCQSALAEAQGEQKTLARASLAVQSVPVLTLPTTAPPPVEVSSTAPTIPALNAPISRRPRWRNPWIVWGMAAAIAFAVGLSFVRHRQERDELEKTLAASRVDLKKIHEQIAALPARLESERKAKLNELRRKTPPYLHVVAPASLPAHGKAPVHVTLRGLDGEMAAGHVRIRLSEPETGRDVYLKRFETDGHLRAEIEAGQAKPTSELELIVDAETPTSRAVVKEVVRVEPAGYVACLHTNQSIYQPREVLYFRVLVLDRQSLTPPEQPIRMRASLKNPSGRVAAHVDLQAIEGGILAGELPIMEDAAAGLHMLHVAPLAPASVQAVSQTIEVVRGVPGIRLDQARVPQGGVVSGDLTVPPELANAKTAKAKVGENKAVEIPLQPGNAQAARGGANFGSPRADKDAKAAMPMNQLRFAVPVPSNLPAGEPAVPFSLELRDGKNVQTFNGVIPLTPSDYTVDFFPEGGDLIAGVPNRVFYRVRSKSGEPFTGDGRVILKNSTADIANTEFKLGLGYFDFTPEAKEAYTVRLAMPAKIVDMAKPFDALGGIRAEGVVLHVPRAVGREGDPIRLVVRRQGGPRKLVLLANCRGQVVDEKALDVQAGVVAEATLQPPADARGVIRITAYELVSDHLLPVAERLIYRQPIQRLELGCTLDPRPLRSGLRNYRMGVASQDEKAQAAPAWALASVVDERFQSPPRSLSAHFLLLNPIGDGADFDNAQLLLKNTPEAKEMLERFLGTHGWRRFVPAREPSIQVQADATERAAGNSAIPVIVSRQNAPLEQLQTAFTAARAAALRPLQDEAARQSETLTAEEVRASQAVQLAQHSLSEFASETQIRFRLVLGLLRAALLLVALICLMVAVYRLARSSGNTTPAFARAFVALAACIGVTIFGNTLGEIDVPRAACDDQVAKAPMPKFADRAAAFKREVKVQEEKPLVGRLVLLPGQPEGHRLTDGFAKKERDNATQRRVNEQQVWNDQGARALLDRRRDEVGMTAAAMPRSPVNRPQDRFDQARANATISPPPAPAGMGGGVAPAASKKNTMKPDPIRSTSSDLPPPAGPMLKKAGLQGSLVRLEYAHQYAPGLQADTLYWHPALKIDGQAEFAFDLADGPAAYRVILLGHDAAGRFGFFETRLPIPAAR